MYSQIKLSPNDRLALANQYRILAALYPLEADSYQKCYSIVVDGYEIDYPILFQNIDEVGVSEETSRFVMDVLDMYRSLHDSVKRIGDSVSSEKNKTAFMGFDGNNESEMLGYARFLIDSGRWTDVVSSGVHVVNSHMPMKGLYSRMLDRWNRCHDKFVLTPVEIQEILDA